MILVPCVVPTDLYHVCTTARCCSPPRTFLVRFPSIAYYPRPPSTLFNSPPQFLGQLLANTSSASVSVCITSSALLVSKCTAWPAATLHSQPAHLPRSITTAFTLVIQAQLDAQPPMHSCKRALWPSVPHLCQPSLACIHCATSSCCSVYCDSCCATHDGDPHGLRQHELCAIPSSERSLRRADIGAQF